MGGAKLPEPGWALATTCKPWERQPQEPSHHYAAFVVYREAGLDRDIPDVAHKVGVKPHNVWTWARRWRWIERTAAWDNEQEAQRSRAEAEMRAEVAKRHGQIAAQYINVMAAPAVEMGKRLKEGRANLTAVTDDDLWKLVKGNAALLRVLVDTERLSHKLPTEHRAVSAPDGGPVQTATTVVEVVRELFQATGALDAGEATEATTVEVVTEEEP